mmetsp:Transcript_10619/g.65472  ORF Transcript_10619/g.65472 Transcript_10619/m.65472 type:complete len:191 (-) Transcript_10619:4709-5281(-)
MPMCTMDPEHSLSREEKEELEHMLGIPKLAEAEGGAERGKEEKRPETRSRSLMKELQDHLSKTRIEQTYRSSLEDIMAEIKGKETEQDSSDEEAEAALEMTTKYKRLAKFLLVRTQAQVALQSQLKKLTDENMELREEVNQLQRENTALHCQLSSQTESQTSPKRRKYSQEDVNIDSLKLHDKDNSMEGP